MTNWTPSTIYQRANAIADMAQQIDAQIWYAHRHGVVQTESFNRHLQQKIDDLNRAIKEFNALSIDDIMAELREEFRDV